MRSVTYCDSSSNYRIKQIQNEKNVEKRRSPGATKEADGRIIKRNGPGEDGDLKTIIIVDL